MRCDYDKHPNIRAAHVTNFNSLRQTSSQLLSLEEKTKNKSHLNQRFAADIVTQYAAATSAVEEKKYNMNIILISSLYLRLCILSFVLLFYYLLHRFVIKKQFTLPTQ